MRNSETNEHRQVYLLISCFLISRFVYWAVGVRFDATPLEDFWQYIDPLLLKKHLWESLLYFHAQPPLFNLFLGICLKVFGQYAPYAFQAVFMAASLGGFFAMYQLLTGLGISRNVSCALVVLYMVSPTAIAYENWLYVTWPVAMLLLLAAFFLHRYLIRPTRSSALLFFGVLGAVALMRSAFHLIWILAILFGLFVVKSGHWKQTIMGSLICLLLILGVYTKNYVLFSTFSGSSWQWINLSQIARLPEAEQKALIQAGKLSPFANIWGFSAPEIYAKYISLPPSPWNIPVLDHDRKSTGEPNMNHRIYVRVSEMRKQDDLYIIRHYPRVYMKNIFAAFLIFTMPATEYSFIRHNVERTGFVEHLYSVGLYGKLPQTIRAWLSTYFPLKHVYEMGFLVLASLVLVACSGGVILVRCLSERRLPRNTEIVYLFLWLTILFAAMICTLFEIRENNRFRVMIEPLLFVCAAVSVRHIFRKWQTSKVDNFVKHSKHAPTSMRCHRA